MVQKFKTDSMHRRQVLQQPGNDDRITGTSASWWSSGVTRHYDSSGLLNYTEGKK